MLTSKCSCVCVHNSTGACKTGLQRRQNGSLGGYAVEGHLPLRFKIVPNALKLNSTAASDARMCYKMQKHMLLLQDRSAGPEERLQVSLPPNDTLLMVGVELRQASTKTVLSPAYLTGETVKHVTSITKDVVEFRGLAVRGAIGHFFLQFSFSYNSSVLQCNTTADRCPVECCVRSAPFRVFPLGIRAAQIQLSAIRESEQLPLLTVAFSAPRFSIESAFESYACVEDQCQAKPASTSACTWLEVFRHPSFICTCEDSEIDIIGDVSYISVFARLQQRGLNVSNQHLAGAEMRNWSNSSTVNFEALRILKKAGSSFSILFDLRTPFATHSAQSSLFDVLPHFGVVSQPAFSACGQTESVSIGMVDRAGEDIRVYEDDRFFMYVSPGDGFDGFKIEDQGIEQRQRQVNSSLVQFDSLVIRRDQIECLGDFRLKFTLITMRTNSSFHSSSFTMRAYDLIMRQPCGIRFSEIFQVASSDHSKFLPSGVWDEEVMGAGNMSLSPPSYTAAGSAGFGYLTFNPSQSQYLDAGIRRLDIHSNGGFTILAIFRFNGTSGYNETIVSFGNADSKSHISLARSQVSGGISVSILDGSKTCNVATEQEMIYQGKWMNVSVRFDKKSRSVELRINDDLPRTAECFASLADAQYSDIYLGKDKSNSFLNADVVGVHIADRVLPVRTIAALHASMVQSRNIFHVSEFNQGKLPSATLVMIDHEHKVIPSSSPVVSATLQTQSKAGACDDTHGWTNLPNLKGTLAVVAQGGYVVFTDLSVHDVARDCLRIQFSLDGYLNTSGNTFRMFPSLYATNTTSGQDSLSIALNPWMRLGQAVETIQVYSSDALAFKLEAVLQSCSLVTCKNDTMYNGDQACRSRKQPKLSPSISTELLSPIAAHTSTEVSDGLGGFLEVRAASVTVKEIHQSDLFPLSLNTFTVKLAFNVNITGTDPFIITLSGLHSATEDDPNFAVKDANSTVPSTSDWFSRVEWRQCGGRLVLHMSAAKPLMAGHGLAFQFELRNGRVLPSKLEAYVKTTGQHLIPLVSLDVFQPVTIASPHIEAAARYVSPWMVQSNRISIRLQANFNLRDSESHIFISGLRINPSCGPFKVSSSCGHVTAQWTNSSKTDLLLERSLSASAATTGMGGIVTTLYKQGEWCHHEQGSPSQWQSMGEVPSPRACLEKVLDEAQCLKNYFYVDQNGVKEQGQFKCECAIAGAPTLEECQWVTKCDNLPCHSMYWYEVNVPGQSKYGKECNISIDVENINKELPPQNVSVRFVANFFSAETSAHIDPIEATFVVKQYGMRVSSSSSSSNTIGLTLVANTVLRGDDTNGGLVFRIWGLSSEQSVPVSVSIYDRLDAVSSNASVFCQPASIAHDQAHATACLSQPSCRRNNTCISPSTELCSEDTGVIYPMTCSARTLQLSASQSFVLRGSIPLGHALVFEWEVDQIENQRLNLTCSTFGETMFVLDDTFQQLYGYSRELSRVPDFVHTKIGQTTSWPMTANQVHITLVAGHIIPEGSLLTISGLSEPGGSALQLPFESAGALSLNATNIITSSSAGGKLENTTEFVFQAATDLLRGVVLEIVVPMYNPATRRDAPSVFVRVSRAPSASTSLCAECFLEPTAILHDTETILPLDGALPGDASPMKVHDLQFITLTVGQRTTFPSANNTISLTMVSNANFASGANLLLWSLDGAFEKNSTILKPIVAGVKMVFDFNMTNPSEPRDAAKIRVQLFSDCEDCTYIDQVAKNAKGDAAPLIVRPPRFEVASLTAATNFPVRTLAKIGNLSMHPHTNK